MGERVVCLHANSDGEEEKENQQKRNEMEVFLLNAHNRTNEQRIMPTKQHQMAGKNRMYLLRNHIAF